MLRTSPELDGIPNIGLFIPRKIDGLGVATALYVRHSIVSPAMLVVTDQVPIVIRRQCRLPGT